MTEILELQNKDFKGVMIKMLWQIITNTLKTNKKSQILNNIRHTKELKENFRTENKIEIKIEIKTY